MRKIDGSRAVHRACRNVPPSGGVARQGVIFDADGTLLDSMPLWLNAGEKYLASLGIKAEDGLSILLRDMGMEEAADYLIRHYRLKAADGTPLARMDAVQGVCAMVERGYAYDVPLKAGVKESLDELQRMGVPYAIATATDRRLLQSAFERLEVDIADNMIFTCTELNTNKDSADVYIAAMKGIWDAPCPQSASRPLPPAPSSFIIFEDTLRYAKTAVEAGFFVAGVLDDGAKEDWEEMRQVCNVVMHDFAEIDWKELIG